MGLWSETEIIVKKYVLDFIVQIYDPQREELYKSCFEKIFTQYSSGWFHICKI